MTGICTTYDTTCKGWEPFHPGAVTATAVRREVPITAAYMETCENLWMIWPDSWRGIRFE